MSKSRAFEYGKKRNVAKTGSFSEKKVPVRKPIIIERCKKILRDAKAKVKREDEADLADNSVEVGAPRIEKPAKHATASEKKK